MSQVAFDFLLAKASCRHPRLSESIEQVGPLTLTANKEVPFAEKLCRSIAGQQLSVKAAQTIWSRVLQSAGDTELLHHLQQTSAEQLRSCGLSAAKCKAIKGIAQQVGDSTLDCVSLDLMNATQRQQRLIMLWGVGNWTVDMMNIFYFAEPDIWPDNDVTARKTLLRLTNEQQPSAETAAVYAPYRSYLALYMYEIADAQPD